jgi:NAD(P)-dependent dehydrogenase (short-subunit alcohol dehydrogenase family)
LDPDKALKAFALNCVAPIFLAKILLKALARAGNSSIVNVTSIAADINIPGEVIYGATKSALRHASESMSIEFARFGIRVNCVAPALVATPLTQHLSQNQKEFMLSKQAHSQEVRPHDVAVVIQSIIEGSKFVTGSTLYVGGVVR